MSEGKRMRRRTVWCLWMMLHKPKEAVQRTITAMREKKNGDDGKRTCWVREAENTHTITQAHKHTQRIVCVGLYVRVCAKLPCSSPTDFISRSICTEPDALHCVGWNTEMLKLILAPPPSSPQKIINCGVYFGSLHHMRCFWECKTHFS